MKGYNHVLCGTDLRMLKLVHRAISEPVDVALYQTSTPARFDSRRIAILMGCNQVLRVLFGLCRSAKV